MVNQIQQTKEELINRRYGLRKENIEKPAHGNLA